MYTYRSKSNRSRTEDSRNFLRKDLRLFPTKLQLTSLFTDDHKVWRLRFTELKLDAGYLKRIFFSDVYKFSFSESVNKQNYRIWGSERLYEVDDTIHNSPSIMICCALSVQRKVEPFPRTKTFQGFNEEEYCAIWFPKLNEYPESVIFQQYGALSHYSRTARRYLDRKLCNQWIGRGGPISWPSRSSDLMPDGFFCESFRRFFVLWPSSASSHAHVKIGACDSSY